MESAWWYLCGGILQSNFFPVEELSPNRKIFGRATQWNLLNREIESRPHLAIDRKLLEETNYFSRYFLFVLHFYKELKQPLKEKAVVAYDVPWVLHC